jgi:hypothetical protein
VDSLLDWLGEELIGVSEFASLAGTAASESSRTAEQRAAALRMMQRRDSSFPHPRSRSGRAPLFRLADLIEWSERRGSDVTLDPAWVVSRAATALGRAEGMDAARRYGVGVLLAHALGSKRGRSRREESLRVICDALLSEVTPASTVALLVTEAFERALASGITDSDLVEVVLGELSTTSGVDSTSTPEGLGELLVAVAGPRRGDRIYDPAFGEGAMALEVVRRTGGQIQLAGREIDPWAWRMASARMYLHGVNADLQDGPSDALAPRTPGVGADLVLVDPPLAKDFRAWVDTALTNVKPGGRAVLSLPSRSLAPERGLWCQLPLGTVERVVAGPDRLRTDTGDSLAVWVLVPGRKDTRTLLVDARSAGRWSGTRKTISDPQLFARSRLGFRAKLEMSTQPTAPHVVLTADDLRRSNGDLRPETSFQDPDLDAHTDRALRLATELGGLVEGPLRERTTAEHRRAIERLVKRLESFGDGPDGGGAGRPSS